MNLDSLRIKPAEPEEAEFLANVILDADRDRLGRLVHRRQPRDRRPNEGPNENAGPAEAERGARDVGRAAGGGGPA